MRSYDSRGGILAVDTVDDDTAPASAFGCEANLFGQFLGAFQRTTRQQDRKFVSTAPRDGVALAHRGLKQRRNAATTLCRQPRARPCR